MVNHHTIDYCGNTTWWYKRSTTVWSSVEYKSSWQDSVLWTPRHTLNNDVKKGPFSDELLTVMHQAGSTLPIVSDAKKNNDFYSKIDRKWTRIQNNQMIKLPTKMMCQKPSCRYFTIKTKPIKTLSQKWQLRHRKSWNPQNPI